MDTAAVADRDTATTPAATDSDPEAAQAQVTETEASDSTDSAEPDGDRVYSKAELDAALKSQEAKLNESARQKAENARKEAQAQERDNLFNARSTAAEQARNGRAAQRIHGLMVKAHKAGEEAEALTWDKNEFGNAVGELTNMAYQTVHEDYVDEFKLYLEENAPDFAVPRELTAQLERATRDYDRRTVARTWMSIAEKALESKLSPKLRKEVMDQLAQGEAEAKEEGAIKDADTRERRPGKPTNGLAGSSGVRTDLKKLSLTEAIALETSGELDKLIASSKR